MWKEVRRAWGDVPPLEAWNWRHVARWRWAVWAVGVVCAAVSFDTRGQGATAGVLGAVALVCLLASVPPWRFQPRNRSRSGPLPEAGAEYRKLVSALGADFKRAVSARPPVSEVPARFRTEHEARLAAQRAQGPEGTARASSVPERYERQARIRLESERFAADVAARAKTAEEQRYASQLRARIAEEKRAYDDFATGREKALEGLIERLLPPSPEVPQAIIDARRAQLAAVRALHRAVLARDPQAARDGAAASVAAERDVKALESKMFGGARPEA
jgi:hypothetical protein